MLFFVLKHRRNKSRRLNTIQSNLSDRKFTFRSYESDNFSERLKTRQETRLHKEIAGIFNRDKLIEDEEECN